MLYEVITIAQRILNFVAEPPQPLADGVEVGFHAFFEMAHGQLRFSRG